MTDRIASFTVVLKQDTRDDDLAPLMDAVRQFAAVAQVVPGDPVDVVTLVARTRIKNALLDNLIDFLGKQS